MKKESNEPIIFSPSKAQSYLGVGIYFVFAIIISFRYIEGKHNHLVFPLSLVLISSWMITYYLVLIHNHLTFSSSGLFFEGRTAPFFLRKRVELSWKDFQYCRTRSYPYGRYGGKY